LSDYPEHLPEYDDSNFPVNEEMMDFARQKAKEMEIEIDEKMIRHLGFLFARDALVIYKDKVNLDNNTTTAHFENIQSTNWNSMRLKLPPSHDSTIGWRVEFRSMEIQLTDDENAAFSILVQIFVRMLYEDWFKLNLYIPMSLNEINFRRANKKDALLKEKFYFRTNIFDQGKPIIQEMTAHEIFFGAP
jgi:glutamate--cysteine ligase catalytic subunit